LYLPEHFSTQNASDISAVADENPFAVLISNGPDVPAISHVPVLLEEREDNFPIVLGHLASANPHARLLAAGGVVTVVFNGPHAYVSPSWYDNTALVPTWNYVAVHMTGHISMNDDVEANRTLVDRLSQHFESGFESPWRVDYDRGGIERMLGFITSFSIDVTSVEAKFKLGQNRSTADRKGVISMLEKGDGMSQAVARWMRRSA
jgi:transcriptional regulator